jgi:hypothetical protein
MTKSLLVFLVLALFVSVSASDLTVWIGGDFDEGEWNNTMNISPDQWVDIPVYIVGEDPSVSIADMMFPLGINKTYVDQFADTSCRVYYPMTEWDVAEFVNFNDNFEESWSSISFLGLARISHNENPWGQWESPALAMSFRVHIKDDFQLTEEPICDAFGVGFDPFQGNANAGDTLGGAGFSINQHYCCITYELTAIDEDIPVPDDYFLANNYPNPFNPTTTIKYGLPEMSQVSIEIFDILGRKVVTLVNEEQPAGYYQTKWTGNSQSTGMYFYRIHAGTFTETKKMLMLK